MAKIAYIRVSTNEQNTDRQKDILKEHGTFKQVFEEKISGATTARPQLQKMLEYVREGDTVVIESLSRLARSARDLLNIVETLQEKKVGLISLKEKFDTNTPQGRFMLQIFAAVNELDRATIKQRQREGIDAARRRGKRLGRPSTEYPQEWKAIYSAWESKKLETIEAAKKCKISKVTFLKLASKWSEHVGKTPKRWAKGKPVLRLQKQIAGKR